MSNKALVEALERELLVWRRFPPPHVRQRIGARLRLSCSRRTPIILITKTEACRSELSNWFSKAENVQCSILGDEHDSSNDCDSFGRNFAGGRTVMRMKLRCVIVHSCPGVFLMDGIIYLVGLIVIVMFILSFLGLH